MLSCHNFGPKSYLFDIQLASLLDFFNANVALWFVGHMSINDSIVYEIGTLPEAKMGPVKRMPKRGMDSCRLYALAFNYLDLLFSQAVKLVDQGVYLPVSWPRSGTCG